MSHPPYRIVWVVGASLARFRGLWSNDDERVSEKAHQVAVSKIVIGRLPSEAGSYNICSCTRRRNRNDELLELAGLEKTRICDVEHVFLNGIGKLGINIPDVRKATLFLAKEIG